MAVPATTVEFLELVRKSGVADEKRLDLHVQKLRASGGMPAEAAKLAGLLVRDGLLTHFQAEQLMQGKWRRFTIGKYKVLERLGSGGMGQVYLCEHKLMRRRVAVKVLPTAKAADPSALERFYREARAVAALDHPNIVHAYDIDQEENLHFLVMEYVDGSSLQDIVKKSGPMDATRAAHYIRQAAQGLEHAHAAGLVHRDIKPGNILVDRSGIVKVLDMGLARFFNDEDDILTRKYDENVLGTADYLAPEQAVDSHGVDIRADIYSLGATFYYLLTGRTPFGEGTVAQKLLWHQSRHPKPLSNFRNDVPAGLTAIIDKMMAKEPAQRYQSPGAVVEALAPWTQEGIAPPPDKEMPRLSLAATGVSPVEATLVTTSPPPPGPGSPAPQKTWQVPAAGSRPATPPPAQPSPPPTPRPRVPVPPPINPPVPSLEIAPEPQVLAPAPPQEEEEAPWESLAADTADPSARVDTTPSSARRVLRDKQKRAQTQERRRLRRIALVVTTLALAALGAGFFLWFSLRSESGPQIRRFQVGNNPGPGGFHTIARALSQADSGDIIEILDEVHEENLIVTPGRGATRVTIQAAPGKEVLWKPSRKDEKVLLTLSKAAGFVLKGPGITLDGTIDGKRRVDNLVQIILYCPGLVLENVHCKGFGKSAVRIVNCSGTAKSPVRLINLHTTSKGQEKPEAAVFFDANPNVNPSLNNFIQIIGGEFEGIDPKMAVRPKDNTVNDSQVSWPGK